MNSKTTKTVSIIIIKTLKTKTNNKTKTKEIIILMIKEISDILRTAFNRNRRVRSLSIVTITTSGNSKIR